MKTAQKEGKLEGLTKSELSKKQLAIPPMNRNEVPPPADSDDEEQKSDLACRRRLFLKKARAVASARRVRGRVLLEAVEAPGSGQLHVKDLLKLAEANVPAHKPQAMLSPPPDIFIVPESPLTDISSQE